MVSHVILRKKEIKKDWRLFKPREKNNGGKVFVNKLYEGEKPIEDPEWRIGQKRDDIPVLVTGEDGLEVGTFTEKAKQDRHKHLICTEIYTVLEGKMTIRIENKSVELQTGDEIVVLPGTVHEVVSDKTKPFLTRVHSVSCHGDRDKYIEENGIWIQMLTRKILQKTNKKKER